MIDQTTQIGPDGARYPIGSVPAVDPADHVSDYVIWGTPTDGQVPVWNPVAGRLEWGDAAGGGLNEAEVDARVQIGIDNVVATAPGTLDTLNEIAAALADDPDFATTMTTLIATKANAAADNITAATWRTALDVLDAASVAEVDGSNVDAATWRTALDVLQDSAIAAAYAASADVRTIDVVTQAAYDALGTPDANTLYLIVG